MGLPINQSLSEIIALLKSKLSNTEDCLASCIGQIVLYVAQSLLWPRIYTTDKRFSAIMKVISFVSLIPMNTAACERGFSSMNRIKSKGISGISNDMLNSLMRISIDGLELEKFDPQPAVTYWSKEKNHRPGFRKTSKSTTDCDTGHTHTPTLSDDSDLSDGKMDTTDIGDIESEEIIDEF